MYIVVSDFSKESFLKEVNKKRKEGFVLCGGVPVVCSDGGLFYYHQAMEEVEPTLTPPPRKHDTSKDDLEN